MTKPKLVTVDPFVRGDTPLFNFPITMNGEMFDLTGWSAYFTLTANANPSSNSDAVIALAPMVIDVGAGTASYQTTNAITSTLVPATKYYFDVQVNKNPTDTNNFTVVRGTVDVVADFGIGIS